MADPLAAARTRNVPQTERQDEAQVRNHAGGYTFTVDWEQRLLRFLILGTQGGTYYVSEQEHTKENFDAIRGVIHAHGREAVDLIRQVSLAGRAPKQNQTMFALALAASSDDVEVRRYALHAIHDVCRTGTHLFLFVKYLEQFRGWGRAARREVGAWYQDKSVDDVAFQIVKYGQREGWAHRDVLRVSHPKAKSPEQNALFAWTVGKLPDAELPAVVGASLALSKVTNPTVAATIISQHNLPWETVPSELLNEPVIWEALLPKLGAGALIRQLPRLTRLGLLEAGPTRKTVIGRLNDESALRKARVHPMQVLNALIGYRKGAARSGGNFRPVPQIIDALDEAFYLSFANVTPVGGPVMLALDVSGSMGSLISGTNLTCREATAALAMITARVEEDYTIVGFTGGGFSSWNRRGGTALTHLGISPRQRLDDVIRSISDLSFGTTDCALPMTSAISNRDKFDLFVIYTDNETYAGSMHPHTALQQYRDKMGRPKARCAVVGMTATDFSIADPKDSGMLDVVGFDTATPELISSFARGEL